MASRSIALPFVILRKGQEGSQWTYRGWHNGMDVSRVAHYPARSSVVQIRLLGRGAGSVDRLGGASVSRKICYSPPWWCETGSDDMPNYMAMIGLLVKCPYESLTLSIGHENDGFQSPAHE